MFIGSGSLSKKKSSTTGQQVPATGFQKTTFAHKATAGATSFNLSSLTVPPEMSANGFSNPTIGVLAAAQLFFFRRNLRLWSSVRGDMADFYEYTVSSSNQITFLGFTAEEGEIFQGTIDYNAVSGVQVVAALSPPSTGILTAGTTDYSVGFPFSVATNITSQIGSVLVIRDGEVMMRNTSNASAAAVSAGSATGNYQEVDSGSGLGVIIRFNTIDPDHDNNIIVIPNGRLSEMPTGSMMAVIEALNGQVNNMSTYVAALAGVLQATVLGSAPTNVNLMTFGQVVQALQVNAALKNVSNTWTSPQTFPGRTDGAAAASGNIGQTLSSSVFSNVTALGSTTNTPVGSMVLPAGTWLVWALATYTQVAGETPSGQVGWAVTTSNNIFSNSLPQVNLAMVASASTFNTATQVATVPFLLPTSGQTVFLNAYAQYSGTAPTFGGQIFAVRFL